MEEIDAARSVRYDHNTRRHKGGERLLLTELAEGRLTNLFVDFMLMGLFVDG